jgi:hypothetical protein
MSSVGSFIPALLLRADFFLHDVEHPKGASLDLMIRCPGSLAGLFDCLSPRKLFAQGGDFLDDTASLDPPLPSLFGLLLKEPLTVWLSVRELLFGFCGQFGISRLQSPSGKTGQEFRVVAGAVGFDGL